MGPLGRFTSLARRFKGTACHIKIGAGKTQALAAAMGLLVGVAQLFANRLQLARHRGKLATGAHSSRGDPGTACRSERGNALDRFGQQLFATGLLLCECREAALLWAEGAKDLLDAGAIIDRLLHLSFGSCTASLMARGAGELFDECAALFRLEAQCLVNSTLANEEEPVLGEARTIEQLVEIAEADLLAIEQVLLAAATISTTGNFDFGEWQIKEPILIGDGERYLGEAERAALL